MRWIDWFFAVLAAGVLVGPAVASDELACDELTKCVSCSQYRDMDYYAPGCYASPGFNLTPGCCQCQPNCCDNAWDGYCQEKARWQAFWYWVGTGCSRCCGTTVVATPSENR